MFGSWELTTWTGCLQKLALWLHHVIFMEIRCPSLTLMVTTSILAQIWIHHQNDGNVLNIEQLALMTPRWVREMEKYHMLIWANCSIVCKCVKLEPDSSLCGKSRIRFGWSERVGQPVETLTPTTWSNEDHTKQKNTRRLFTGRLETDHTVKNRNY